MDRFEDMRCFVQVVEQGSVTRAAEAMNVAPSAVSRRLKDLEARLGAQLLTRTTRRMSLTEAGQGFFVRCQRILADLAEAEAEAGDATGQLAGTLRVAAPLSFGVGHLAPIIADFAAANPSLALDLDLSDRLVDLVGEGFDLAIRIGNLRDSSLVARRLCDVAMIPVAAPAFLADHGPIAVPEALKDCPCLVYAGSERADIWRWRTAAGQQGSVQVPVAMRSNNGDVLAEAAERGLGVTLQPDFILRRRIEAGRLVPVLTDLLWPEIAVHTVYPQTRHLSAKARAFIDFVQRRLVIRGARPGAAAR